MEVNNTSKNFIFMLSLKQADCLNMYAVEVNNQFTYIQS